MMLEWVRFGFCALFCAAGLVFLAAAWLGVNRFSFSLTRLHAAGMGDTMGLFCLAAGLIIGSSDPAVTGKLVIMVVFLWLSSPVSSHLLGELIYLTDPRVPVEVRPWKS